MAFSLHRAMSLIGKPRSEYQCNHVVNEVLNGQKDKGGLAKDYFDKFGIILTYPCAGAVIAGKSLGAGNPWHCGIFISNTEFIHSSSSASRVIKVSIIQIPYIFLNNKVDHYLIKKFQ